MSRDHPTQNTHSHAMNTDPGVVVLHHSLTSLFSTEEAYSLREQIQAGLTEDIPIRLAETPHESRTLLEEAEIAVTILPFPELIDDAPHLRWIQTLGAGVEQFDFDVLEDNNITLTNASGVAAEPIAEHVLGYMLLFEREFTRGMRQQTTRQWERYTGGELAQKTVGIVGLGAIGTRVAELSSSFGMDILGVKRDPSTTPSVVSEEVVYPPSELQLVVSRSDYVVVSCPLTDETYHLIDADVLQAMKNSGVLINIGRGSIVNEDALIHALKQRIIKGAGLDVFETEPLPEDSPLWGMRNTIITPHMAGYTPQYMDRLSSLFAENYATYKAGDLTHLDTQKYSE